MAYVTLAEWKANRGSLSGATQAAFTAAEDAVLQTFLDQAEAELNAQTKKRYEAATETHYFRPCDMAWNNARVLLLKDWLLSVSTLTNGNSTVISPVDYWLLPRGGGPYSAIEIKSSAAGWSFNTDGEISVAGAWGFTATADDRVKRVTMRLAEFFFQKRATTGESQVIGEGQIIVAAMYPEDVRDFILGQRRRQPA